MAAGFRGILEWIGWRASPAADVPTVAGAEFTLQVNRPHYTLPDNLPHFTLPENRPHFTLPTEDRP